MTELRLLTKKEIPLKLIGWREWVALPFICGESLIKTKVDTGARSSSLHTYNHLVLERGGETWIQFDVPDVANNLLRSCLPVYDIRDIRSSSGEVQSRYMVRTTIKVGHFFWDIELSLADRETMTFPMLLGREAIRRRFIVDPGASFLFGHHPDQQTADEEENSEEVE